MIRRRPTPSAPLRHLHDAAALHYRLLARTDPSGHAELLAAVHAELARNGEKEDVRIIRAHPETPDRVMCVSRRPNQGAE